MKRIFVATLLAVITGTALANECGQLSGNAPFTLDLKVDGSIENNYLVLEHNSTQDIPELLWFTGEDLQGHYTYFHDTGLEKDKVYDIRLEYLSVGLRYFRKVEGETKWIFKGEREDADLKNGKLLAYASSEEVSLSCEVDIAPTPDEEIIPDPEAPPPPPPAEIVYSFVVNPLEKHSLTCSRTPVEFKLINEIGGVIDADVAFLPLSEGSWCETLTGDDCGIQIADLIHGKKTLYLSSDTIGSKSVAASFIYQDYLGGSVEFVPYKFQVQPTVVDMVAGKGEVVEVKALACDNGEVTTAKGYSKTLGSTASLVTPLDGSLGDFSVSELSFEDGVALTTVKWGDVGQVTVSLIDEAFDCSVLLGGSNCPINGGVLKGGFTVKSRPLTVAACSITGENGKLNPGTTISGEGFSSSGHDFNVIYKPVAYSESSQDVCSNPVTPNYYSDTPVGIEFSVAYPLQGDIANLSEPLQVNFVKGEANGKSIAYSWDEVGSLNLITKGSYLGVPMDSHEVVVGRFYPKYFMVKDSSWTYPNGQSFIYMDQPFDQVEFEVEALNGKQDPVKNYAQFDVKNQAVFNIGELGSFADRFDAPNSVGSWSLVSGISSIGSFKIVGNSICGVDSVTRNVGSPCWYKKHAQKGYADGEFNLINSETEIGLVYTENTDPVDYLLVDGVSDGRLIDQPTILFGRVKLQDVGGMQGDGHTITIPATVEYWDGTRFLPNIFDQQTELKAIVEKQEVIWTTGDYTTIVLQGGDIVLSGKTRSIKAKQEESKRQQTRVWLDLEETPWLRYDWGNTGIEDNPSSLVTFGVYRGNDKVIYRGEPGLLGSK